VCAELEWLQRPGWRGSAFMVEDNFIGACDDYERRFTNPQGLNLGLESGNFVWLVTPEIVDE
jgi:hypothetical protein